MGHIPVLLDETIEALQVKPGGRYVDGTFGRGGHTRAILAAGGEVLGIDCDWDAVRAGEELQRECPKFKIVHGQHSDIRKIAERNGWNEVDGVLLDLGVSSPQLDEAGRGFSFMREGPLDMRMDRTQPLSAGDLVNGGTPGMIARALRDNGEVPNARRIANAISKRVTDIGPFNTTTEFADFIVKLVGRHGGKHPATRIFQGLRIEVNSEILQLDAALNRGLDILKPGGRMAVITFESISDRWVKRFFKMHVGAYMSLQQGGSRWIGVDPRGREVLRGGVTPQESEVERNPRARSARLRVLERMVMRP